MGQSKFRFGSITTPEVLAILTYDFGIDMTFERGTPSYELTSLHAQIAVLRQAESSKFCNRLRVTGLQAVLQVAGGLTRGSPAECDEFVPLPGAYPNI